MPSVVALARASATFINGILVERPGKPPYGVSRACPARLRSISIHCSIWPS